MSLIFRSMLLLPLLVAASCGGASAEPPAAEPEPATRTAALSDAVAADVAFMQGMIVHHAQALEMAGLVPGRSESEDLATLARRIDQTQRFEIGQMRRWLEERGEPVPDLDASAAAHAHHDMVGMATPEQMARLAGSEGAAFDRLFLELMIRHHQGALVMVEELLERGGGLDPETYVIVSHIDADQRAEIARMQDMLNALQ